MNNRGLFIVLEGSDGSGKTTQFNLLKERLKATGYDVEVFDFPQYKKDSSHFVRQYLAGKYGSASKISPFTASLFYALDRYEAGSEIKQALDAGKIVMADRYVGSNMAHQGSKFADPVEQRGYFVWDDNLEYQLLGIPRPNISFFLRVPAEISRRVMEERAAKSGIELDEHEKDLDHLKKTVSTYDVLCQLFPKDYREIECTRNGRMLSIAEINNQIWKSLKPLLPKERPHPPHTAVVSLSSEQPAKQQPDKSPNGELIFPFKNVSLLLRLQIERYHPLATGGEFSSWSKSSYSFYTPSGLPREFSSAYKAGVQTISSLFEAMRGKLVDYYQKNPSKLPQQSVNQLLLPLTPLAALTSFVVELKKAEVKPLCASLLAQDSEELQWAAQQLYLAARQKWPTDFKQPLESNNEPQPITNIIAQLAADRLPRHAADTQAVKLLEAYPRQEFDLLAETIYPHSNLSLEDIREEVSNWPYQQKYQSLKQAAAAPGLLDKVRYKMDVISDQSFIGQLAAAASLRYIQVQTLTPRYGFEVPEVIELVELDELYNQCFDESLKLYSLLQGAGRDDLAAYVTLMGHKARWQLSTNANSLRLALQASRAWHDRAITETIYEQVSEVHPLLWEIAGEKDQPARAPSKIPPRNRVKPGHQRPKRK